MNFLHYEVNAGPNDVIQVVLDKQANVRLLDNLNFQKYRSGSRHEYRGGLAETSPFNLVAPRHGAWHVVVDLGGYAGSVSAAVQVLRG